MRAALDALEPELDRSVRLVNYCSGLCMPEIAAMGALERLDFMLNDALYGIIFRDINPVRTLIDQRFSRRINAAAGVVINTGEDNYLTTADAVEQAPAVLASQFINERLALDAGLDPWQIGLGHAFEIDPELEDGLLFEIAQAQAAREIFPDSPLKYMPPTKHMTGNVFRGYQQNALFVLTSVATGQSIHLLGMLTEALHTPLLHDRWLAIDQARTIRANARHLAEELHFAPDGRIARRARAVLAQAEKAPRGDRAPGPLRRSRNRPLRRYAPAAPGRARSGGNRPPGIRLLQSLPGGVDAPAGRGRPMSVPAASADRRHVRAYGDKSNDGIVQVSFTLPLPRSGLALEAAKQYAAKMGIRDPYVTLAQSVAPEFTFFIVYGRSVHEVDATAITASAQMPAAASREEIDAEIQRRFGRRLVVLGLRARERRPYRRHRRHLQSEGIRRRLRSRALRRFRRAQPGRAGLRRAARKDRARDARRRDPRLRDRHAKRHPRPPPDGLGRHARGRAPARRRRS